MKNRGNNQSRNDAGQKELAYRLFRHDAEDDKGNTWRDQHPEGPDRGDDTQGEPFVIPEPCHLGDCDTCKGGAGGECRTAHGFEKSCPHDGGHRYAAGDVAYAFFG